IPAVPFKGPALAASAYGNLALREFADLDILLLERDVPRARDLLLAWGYGPRVDETDYDILVYNESQGIGVELHWKFAQRYHLPPDPGAFWGRLEGASLCGRPVRAFSAVDLLLILCAHGAKHGWERLAWVCDVARHLAARGDLDWAEALGRARAL